MQCTSDADQFVAMADQFEINIRYSVQGAYDFCFDVDGIDWYYNVCHTIQSQ